MTAEKAGVAEMLAKAFAEKLSNGIVGLPPAGAVYGDDAVVKTGSRILFGIARYCGASDVVGRTASVYSCVLVGKVVGAFFDLCKGKLAGLIVFKQGILS